MKPYINLNGIPNLQDIKPKFNIMKKNLTLMKWGLALAVPALLFAGCSSMKQAKTDANNMTYKFAGAKAFSYGQTSEMVQSIVYNGQEISSLINTETGFTLVPGSKTGDKISLNVTMDTLGISVESMQGNIVDDIDHIKGKSFNISLSERGEESDLDEAEKITYMIAGQQESNLKGAFLMLFPNLPAEPANVGFSWEENDTIDMSTGTENVVMIMKSVNTVAALEEFGGYNCLKIAYTFTGERNATSNTAEGTISSGGDMNGTGYFYFAPEEGLLVKDHSEIKFDGSIMIPTGGSLPCSAL